jgi:hypothetical protein
MSAIRRLTPGVGARDPDAIETLIDRYLGASDRARVVAWPPQALPGIALTLVDTTNEPAVHPPCDTTPFLWHVLWARDEGAASVTISSDDGDRAWPIAPGDTVPVPAGSRLRADGGQLGLAISVPDGNVTPAPPTHGAERFFGYNRRTVSFETGAARLCRWKLTQPLALAAHHTTPLVVMALARSIVVRTATSIDWLTQGDVATIDPSTDPIVSPDGLAYLFTIETLAE